MANGNGLKSALTGNGITKPVSEATGALAGSLDSFLGTMTNNGVEQNAQVLETAAEELEAGIKTPEIRAKELTRCLPQATSIMRLGFETPEGTNPLRPIDPTEKPLELADLEGTPATRESFEASAVPLSSVIEGQPAIPSVLPVDPGFSLTVPPPMLPLQPGEIGVDIMGNPCDKPGRRVGPETDLAGNGNGNGAIDQLMPLGMFVRENFNLIVVVLLAVILLRGR